MPLSCYHGFMIWVTKLHRTLLISPFGTWKFLAFNVFSYCKSENTTCLKGNRVSRKQARPDQMMNPGFFGRGAQLKWGRQLIIWPIMKFLCIPVGCVPSTVVPAIRCVDPLPRTEAPLDRDPETDRMWHHTETPLWTDKHEQKQYLPATSLDKDLKNVVKKSRPSSVTHQICQCN